MPLVVEVSATTLNDDLASKSARYAAGGIPEYWIVDVDGRIVHQMWSPADEAYVERRHVPFSEPLMSAFLDGLTVATTGL